MLVCFELLLFWFSWELHFSALACMSFVATFLFHGCHCRCCILVLVTVFLLLLYLIGDSSDGWFGRLVKMTMASRLLCSFSCRGRFLARLWVMDWFSWGSGLWAGFKLFSSCVLWAAYWVDFVGCFWVECYFKRSIYITILALLNAVILHW